MIRVFIIFMLSCGVLRADTFRAGAATSNITPPLGVSINGGFRDRRATHIHDELHARCLVLDDGTTKLAFAVVDSCMVATEVIDAAKKSIEEHIGIPPTHVMISATHTHEAPASASVFQSDADPTYQKFLATRISDGVRRAANNLAPAQVGWGSFDAPDNVFNRRWKLKPGTVPVNPFGSPNDQVKTNPLPGSPDLVEPAGPTDPQVWAVSMRAPDGRHIALLANYSLHYIGGESPGNISADYYGMFCERIATRLKAEHQDPPFVAMMSNGTSGNINNISFRTPRPPRHPFEQMRNVADDVAEKVEAVRDLKYAGSAKLSAKTTTLSLKVRKPAADEIDRANKILASSPIPMQTSPEGIYARETLAMAQYPDEVTLTLQVLRIGDLAIAAVPCEVFVEIGLDLKKRSPVKPLFTISLANGYYGYLPTPEQHQLGGYETWRARSSFLETEASSKITAKLMELLAAN